VEQSLSLAIMTKLQTPFDETCPGAIDSSMKEDCEEDYDDSMCISDIIGDGMSQPHWQHNERRISVQLKSSSHSLSLLRELGSIHMDEKEEEVLMMSLPRESSIQRLKRDLVRSMSSYEVIANDENNNVLLADKMVRDDNLSIPSIIAAVVVIALLYAIVTRPVVTFLVLSSVFIVVRQYIVRKYDAEAAKTRKLMKEKRV